MATIPRQRFFQGVLDVVNPLVFTAPSNYQCVVSLLLNNSVAYNVAVDIIRQNPMYPNSTAQIYSLTLDPGDTVETGEFLLFPTDSIEVTTTIPGTTYAMAVGSIKFNPPV
jgi:hypothetical protein